MNWFVLWIKTSWFNLISLARLLFSDGYPGQKFLTRVRSGQFFVAPVGSAIKIKVWVWIWKISPKNINFFPFGSKKSLRVGSKSTWVKGGSASYLLRVKSKLGSGPISTIFLIAPGFDFNVWPILSSDGQKSLGKMGKLSDLIDKDSKSLFNSTSGRSARSS